MVAPSPSPASAAVAASHASPHAGPLVLLASDAASASGTTIAAAAVEAAVTDATRSDLGSAVEAQQSLQAEADAAEAAHAAVAAAAVEQNQADLLLLGLAAPGMMTPKPTEVATAVAAASMSAASIGVPVAATAAASATAATSTPSTDFFSPYTAGGLSHPNTPGTYALPHPTLLPHPSDAFGLATAVAALQQQQQQQQQDHAMTTGQRSCEANAPNNAAILNYLTMQPAGGPSPTQPPQPPQLQPLTHPAVSDLTARSNLLGDPLQLYTAGDVTQGGPSRGASMHLATAFHGGLSPAMPPLSAVGSGAGPGSVGVASPLPMTAPPAAAAAPSSGADTPGRNGQPFALTPKAPSPLAHDGHLTPPPSALVSGQSTPAYPAMAMSLGLTFGLDLAAERSHPHPHPHPLVVQSDPGRPSALVTATALGFPNSSLSPLTDLHRPPHSPAAAPPTAATPTVGPAGPLVTPALVAPQGLDILPGTGTCLAHVSAGSFTPSSPTAGLLVPAASASQAVPIPGAGSLSQAIPRSLPMSMDLASSAAAAAAGTAGAAAKPPALAPMDLTAAPTAPTLTHTPVVASAYTTPVVPGLASVSGAPDGTLLPAPPHPTHPNTDLHPHPHPHAPMAATFHTGLIDASMPSPMANLPPIPHNGMSFVHLDPPTMAMPMAMPMAIPVGLSMGLPMGIPQAPGTQSPVGDTSARLRHAPLPFMDPSPPLFTPMFTPLPAVAASSPLTISPSSSSAAAAAAAAAAMMNARMTPTPQLTYPQPPPQPPAAAALPIPPIDTMLPLVTGLNPCLPQTLSRRGLTPAPALLSAAPAPILASAPALAPTSSTASPASLAAAPAAHHIPVSISASPLEQNPVSLQASGSDFILFQPPNPSAHAASLPVYPALPTPASATVATTVAAAVATTAATAPLRPVAISASAATTATAVTTASAALAAPGAAHPPATPGSAPSIPAGRFPAGCPRASTAIPLPSTAVSSSSKSKPAAVAAGATALASPRLKRPGLMGTRSASQGTLATSRQLQLRMSNAYNKWTPEEDALLRAGVALHGTTGKWPAIASMIAGRSAVQCSTRWSGALNTTIIRGKWRREDDAILREAYAEQFACAYDRVMEQRANSHVLDAASHRSPTAPARSRSPLSSSSSSPLSLSSSAPLPSAPRVSKTVAAFSSSSSQPSSPRNQPGARQGRTNYQRFGDVPGANLGPDDPPEALIVSALNWQKVADRVPGRTSLQCMARYQETLDPRIRKGKWDAWEDELLVKGLHEHGKSWIKISTNIPGRTQRQCRTRWLQLTLKPSMLDQWGTDTVMETVSTSPSTPVTGVPAGTTAAASPSPSLVPSSAASTASAASGLSTSMPTLASSAAAATSTATVKPPPPPYTSLRRAVSSMAAPQRHHDLAADAHVLGWSLPASPFGSLSPAAPAAPAAPVSTLPTPVSASAAAVRVASSTTAVLSTGSLTLTPSGSLAAAMDAAIRIHSPDIEMAESSHTLARAAASIAAAGCPPLTKQAGLASASVDVPMANHPPVARLFPESPHSLGALPAVASAAEPGRPFEMAHLATLSHAVPHSASPHTHPLSHAPAQAQAPAMSPAFPVVAITSSATPSSMAVDHPLP